MNACAGCDRHNAPQRRYCGGCGSKLIWDCATCAFVNHSDDLFCGGCGEAAVGAVERAPARAAALASVPRQRTGPLPKGRAPALEVSVTELAALLAPIEQPVAAPEPAGRITQDDLDNLFKAGS